MAYGCSSAMLAGMVCDGFITLMVDTARRLRITDAGRKAIED
jgi:hypothetical protein